MITNRRSSWDKAGVKCTTKGYDAWTKETGAKGRWLCAWPDASRGRGDEAGEERLVLERIADVNRQNAHFKLNGVKER
jgi:hypothetical protein